MANEIDILTVRVGEPLKQEKIANTLEAFQALVGGYIEVVHTSVPGLVLVCNEEGMLNELPFNRGLQGDWFIVRTEGDDFASVLSNDLEQIKALSGWR